MRAAATTADAIGNPPRRSVRVNGYLLGAICVAVIALMVFPILVTFLSSIKTAAEASSVPPHYLPHTLSIENYAKVYHYQAGLLVYVFNSLTVALLTIVLCVVLAVPAGYGLARFPIPGREVIFLILIAGLMIPYQALLTPLHAMFSQLGIANTHLGLAIVHTILQLPFSIYLARSGFESVPRELEEAAIVDGCGSVGALWRLFLPVTRPAIVTIVLFAFIASWNEFLAALIFMSKETRFTVPIMLVGVRQGHFGAVDWGALQAGVVISILPCMVIYLLLRKYYQSGLLSGAIK